MDRKKDDARKESVRYTSGSSSLQHTFSNILDSWLRFLMKIKIENYPYYCNHVSKFQVLGSQISSVVQNVAGWFESYLAHKTEKKNCNVLSLQNKISSDYYYLCHIKLRNKNNSMLSVMLPTSYIFNNCLSSNIYQFGHTHD